MPPVLSIKGLSKSYKGGLQALKTVDLEIERGEIFALLGPNGGERAGKYNSWRGSRAPDKCTLGRTGEFLDNLEKSRPQQKLNSVKRYGCYYTAGRLLYTATVVAKG